MKNLFLLFFCLFLATISFAQTPQTELKRTVFEPPKTVNGFKVRWATLSKGKYQEVFTNDTIQQIGSVYFNRITGEVVGEVEKDSLYFPASVSSRWWSVDPLGESFHNKVLIHLLIITLLSIMTQQEVQEKLQ